MARRKRGVRDGDSGRADCYSRRVRRAESGGEVPDVPAPPTVLRPAVTEPHSTPEKKASTPSVPGRITALTRAAPGSHIESVTDSRDGGPCRDNGGGGGTVAGCRAGVGGNSSTSGYSGARGNSSIRRPPVLPPLWNTKPPVRLPAAEPVRAEDGPYVPVSISAGEVDDNEQWEEYLRYRLEFQGPRVHNVDVSERYAIAVADAGGRPVPNAVVRVSTGETLLFQGRTYANGQTLFFPRAHSAAEGVEEFRLYVERNGVNQSLDVARGERSDWVVTLDTTVSYDDGVPLDILFLLDSTGSMSDEINQIKETLLSISSRIADLPSQPDLHYGMVSYRDRGDEYVTRVYEFDSDVPRFLEAVRGVHADGGDDEPESLNEALHVAVQMPEWRLDDAVRLVFLVADAPPHLDYPKTTTMPSKWPRPNDEGSRYSRSRQAA